MVEYNNNLFIKIMCNVGIIGKLPIKVPYEV